MITTEIEAKKAFTKIYHKDARIKSVDKVQSGEFIIEADLPDGTFFFVVSEDATGTSVSHSYDTRMQARLATKSPYPIQGTLITKKNSFYYYEIDSSNKIEVFKKVDKPLMNFPGYHRTRDVKVKLTKEIKDRMKMWYGIEVHE